MYPEESRLTLTAIETMCALCRGERTPTPEPDPYQLVAARQRSRILRACMGRLAGRQMMLMILMYEYGMSQIAAAAEIGITQSAACQMHHRVLGILRADMAQRGYESSQL